MWILRTLTVVSFLFLSAGVPQAAVFLVPEDDELARKSSAIVVGTVTAIQPQLNDRGEIVTHIRLSVEEFIKARGLFRSSNEITLVERGGEIGTSGLHVSGNASYWVGERVLVFVDRRDGHDETWGMILGKFDFVEDELGRQLLVRGLGQEEIFGFDSRGRHHVEGLRGAQKFLRYLRQVAAGLDAEEDYFVDERNGGRVVRIREMSSPAIAETTATNIISTSHYPPSAYTSGQMRRNMFDQGVGVTYYVNGSQPGYDYIGAAQRGIAAWTNEPNSNILYVYGGTTTSGGSSSDGVNVILYNQSSGVPAGAIAYTLTAYGTAGDPKSYKGEQFYTITDADIFVKSGLAISQATFDEMMTHELGHSLGFRHSNERDPATSDAVMNYAVSGRWGATLAPWDVDAATHVYGSGTTTPPACTPPTITAQPQPVTASPGQSVTLSVGATGTGPLSYQWYTGASGSTAQPIAGATGPSLTVAPTVTTTYWVRVSNACGSANSTTVTVTVATPTASGPAGFYVVNPCRIVDTRVTGGALAPGAARAIRISGCSVSAVAKAAALNVTVVPMTSTSSGYLTVYPADQPRPNASTINFSRGRVRANNTIARLSSDVTVYVYNGGSEAVHFLIDVTGFFQ